MAAKQLLSVDDDGGKNMLYLHEEVVDSFLMADDVADKPVVVISVAGAYRTGKSFLLNSLSRYLMAADKSHWLDNKSESFSWKSGCDAHTNGMFMSHPIPVTLKSGEELVVLLVDTQGIFDSESTKIDSTKIFALSILLSSVQVYNVMHNLRNDHLENLQLFTEYGRTAKDNTEGKLFQDLVFLIRDWQHKTPEVGSQGGKELVQKRLSSSIKSIAQQNQHMTACFTDVSGFLLPHPGEEVAGSETFAGDAEDMNLAFIRALEDFMSTLLSPEKLTVKMNGNHPMTCRELVTHIKTYTDLFRSNELQDVGSLMQALAEIGNTKAIHDELDAYEKQMEGLLGRDAPILDESLLYKEHELAKEAALQSFKERKTMRDATKEENYYQLELEEKVEESFEKAHTNKKYRDLQVKKLKEASEKLVDECITIYEKSIPSHFFSSPSDQTLRDEHREAMQKAVEHFKEEEKQFFPYQAGESLNRLRTQMEQKFDMALEYRKEIQENLAADAYDRAMGM